MSTDLVIAYTGFFRPNWSFLTETEISFTELFYSLSNLSRSLQKPSQVGSILVGNWYLKGIIVVPAVLCITACVRVSVGNGEAARFWHDRWIGEDPLASQFPAVFALADNPHAKIWFCWQPENQTWDIKLKRRRLSDSEMEEYTRLLGLLPALSSSTARDKISWLRVAQSFSVKTTRISLERSRCERNQLGFDDFPGKMIWQHRANPRACFTAWLIALGRILTDDQLMRRGFELTSQCSLCYKSDEDALHLFFNCEYSEAIWSFFSIGFCTRPPSGNSTREKISSWKRGRLSKAGTVLFILSLQAILWEIWKERNARRFDGRRGRQWWQAVQAIQETLWTWCWAFDDIRDVSFEKLLVDWASVCWEM